VIGKDYPDPIVNEKEARESSLKKMKEGYEKNRYGADPQDNSSSSSPSKPKTSPSKKQSNASQETLNSKGAAKKPAGTGSKRKPDKDIRKSPDGSNKQLKLDFKPSE
jgi:hypothetical protein